MKPHLKKTNTGWCAWLSRRDSKTQPPLVISCRDKNTAFRDIERFVLLVSFLKKPVLSEVQS